VEAGEKEEEDAKDIPCIAASSSAALAGMEVEEAETVVMGEKRGAASHTGENK
jgi:hypothetical protein